MRKLISSRKILVLLVAICAAHTTRSNANRNQYKQLKQVRASMAFPHNNTAYYSQTVYEPATTPRVRLCGNLPAGKEGGI
jgi:hypothetical protein